MKFTIPRSLKIEHEELHEELAKATKASGKIGDAAKAVVNVLHPHFIKEEEYALPPLGVLRLISDGKTVPEMGDVLKMTEKLKADLPHMLKEHKSIVTALKVLTEASRKEKKMEYVQFADKLILHAQNEEKVLYPTALLIGEYVKLRK